MVRYPASMRNICTRYPLITYRQTERDWTEIHINEHEQTDSQTDRQTQMDTNRQTDKWTDNKKILKLFSKIKEYRVESGEEVQDKYQKDKSNQHIPNTVYL